MIERHHDYILQVPSLAAGKSIQGAPLVLDLDAPFLCRGIGIRISPPADTRSQADVLSCRFRFKNQTGADLSQIPIQTPAYFGKAFGQNGIFQRVYPQQPYPPGGVIQTDFYNDSDNDLTNLQIIYRGVKLFAPGTISAPTYPARIRPLDFTYQSGKGTPNDPAIILNTTETLYQRMLQINGDADFVLRGGQAGMWTYSGNDGEFSETGYTDLFIQLFDSQLKPYSNLPIHIDWLFGSAEGTGQGGYSYSTGNAAPGLLVPEIYMPKNSVLFFNLIRSDSAYTGSVDALPVRLSIAWIGSKVYA